MAVALLGIDTSNAACSVGLWLDGEVSERYREQPRGHGELLLPMVDALLGEAGLGVAALDALVLGQGPGSFTGLRIAAGVVQGLAFAADRPVVPISSLAALAQVSPGEAILPAFDARMGEVYWGAYRRGQDGLVTATVDDRLSVPEQIEVSGSGSDSADWVAVGEGWLAHREAMSHACAAAGVEPEVLEQPLYPHAGGLVELGARAWSEGAAVPADAALPVYLRNKVV